MVPKHIKKFGLTSLGIRKVEIKTTKIYHDTPTRMV